MVELDKNDELQRIKEMVCDTCIELANNLKLFYITCNPKEKIAKRLTRNHKESAYQMLANSIIKMDALVYFLSKLFNLNDVDQEVIDQITYYLFDSYGIDIRNKENKNDDYKERKRKAS